MNSICAGVKGGCLLQPVGCLYKLCAALGALRREVLAGWCRADWEHACVGLPKIRARFTLL